MTSRYRSTVPVPVALALIVMWMGTLAPVGAAELKRGTIEAFERYVRVTEARIKGELGGATPFLWIDRLPAADREEVQRQLSAAEVAITRLESREAGQRIEIPDGRVHHWLGVIFIPGTTLSHTINMVQAYDRYADIYQPAVRRSRTLARNGGRFKVAMQLFMKKVISVVLNTDYDVDYRSISPTRMYVPSYATRIAEVDSPDTPNAREKPVGRDSGFLWRFNNYCSFEERAGGTYMQCESVSLSRDIPVGLGWLIGPFVTSIPRESLTFTLIAARKELTKKR